MSGGGGCEGVVGLRRVGGGGDQEVGVTVVRG